MERAGISVLNWLWAGIMIVALAAGAVNGRLGEVTNALLSGGGEAIKLSLTLGGAMCLWGGMMRIAEKGGLTELLSKALSPLMRLLFPKLKPDGPACRAILMNMAANFLGLGNAATPFGIRAAQLLAGQGADGLRGLLVLLVINNSGLELMPSAVMTLRQQAGSVAPGAIWLPTLAATGISTLVAVVLLYWTDRREKRG